jgi:hypothetical protein
LGKTLEVDTDPDHVVPRSPEAPTLKFRMVERKARPDDDEQMRRIIEIIQARKEEKEARARKVELARKEELVRIEELVRMEEEEVLARIKELVRIEEEELEPSSGRVVRRMGQVEAKIDSLADGMLPSLTSSAKILIGKTDEDGGEKKAS